MFAKRLKYIRSMRKLTQLELAEKINSTKATISNYENEYSSPSNEVLNDLADALNTTTDYLLGRTDDANRKNDGEYDSLAEIRKIVDDLGIEDLFFHNIDDWKNLTKEDVEEIRNHFEYIAHKARKRKKEE